MTLEEIHQQMEAASSLAERERASAMSAFLSREGVAQQIADSNDASLIALAADAAVLLRVLGMSPDVGEQLLTVNALQTVARDGNASQIQRVGMACQGSSRDHLEKVAPYLYTPEALNRVAGSCDPEAVSTVAFCLADLRAHFVVEGLRTVLTVENLQGIASQGSSADIGLTASACQFLPQVEATRALNVLLTADAVEQVATRSRRAEFIGWVASATWALPQERKVAALKMLLERDSMETLRQRGGEGDIGLVAAAVADAGNAPLIAQAAEAAGYLGRSGPSVAQECLLREDVLGAVASSQDHAAIARMALAIQSLNDGNGSAALDQLLIPVALKTVIASDSPVSAPRVAGAVAATGSVGLLTRVATAFEGLPESRRGAALSKLLSPEAVERVRASQDQKAIRTVAAAVRTLPPERCQALTDALLKGVPPWQRSEYNPPPARAASAAAASSTAGARKAGGPGLG